MAGELQVTGRDEGHSSVTGNRKELGIAISGGVSEIKVENRGPGACPTRLGYCWSDAGMIFSRPEAEDIPPAPATKKLWS